MSQTKCSNKNYPAWKTELVRKAERKQEIVTDIEEHSNRKYYHAVVIQDDSALMVVLKSFLILMTLQKFRLINVYQEVMSKHCIRGPHLQLVV